MNIHAGLVEIDGRGVLVTGPARSGKSSLLLSLLRGAAREGLSAFLVADDRVDIEVRDGALFGHAPAPIAGLIEVSGVGLLRLPHSPRAPIALLASIESAPPRLPETPWETIAGVDVRKASLPAREATFSADVVLTLLRAGDDALQKI